MATLPRDHIPTFDELHGQQRADARAEMISRLQNPNGRPSKLDVDTLTLLQETRKRVVLMTFVAPKEVEQYLCLASCNITSAIHEALLAYPGESLAPLPAIEQPQRMNFLSVSHMKHLRDKVQWLENAIHIAPLEVALYLLRVLEWIRITLIVAERLAREAEQRTAELAESRTLLKS